jgi:hypothetical protein
MKFFHVYKRLIRIVQNGRGMSNEKDKYRNQYMHGDFSDDFLQRSSDDQNAQPMFTFLFLRLIV